jgi:hypothetical protein
MRIPVYTEQVNTTSKVGKAKSLPGEKATPRKVVDESAYYREAQNIVGSQKFQGTGNAKPAKPNNADLDLQRQQLSIQTQQARMDYTEDMNRLKMWDTVVQGATSIYSHIYNSRQDELKNKADMLINEETVKFREEINNDPRYKEMSTEQIQQIVDARFDDILTSATDGVTDNKTKGLIEKSWFGKKLSTGVDVRAFARTNQIDRTIASVNEANQSDVTAFAENGDESHIQAMRGRNLKLYQDGLISRQDYEKRNDQVTEEAVKALYKTTDPSKVQAGLQTFYYTPADFQPGGIRAGQKQSDEIAVGKPKVLQDLPIAVQQVAPDVRADIKSFLTTQKNKIISQQKQALEVAQYNTSQKAENIIARIEATGDTTGLKGLMNEIDTVYVHEPEKAHIEKSKLVEKAELGLRKNQVTQTIPTMKTFGAEDAIIKEAKRNVKTQNDAKVIEHLEKELAAKKKALNTDPADYVAKNFGATNVQDNVAFQVSQGVKPYNIRTTTNEQKESIEKMLNDANGTKLVQTIQGVQAEYATHFDQFKTELDLPGGMDLMLSMNQENQRQVLLQMAQVWNTKTSEMKQNPSLDSATVKDIQERLAAELQDYQKALYAGGYDRRKDEMLRGSVDLLQKTTMAYVAEGMSVSNAVDRVMGTAVNDQRVYGDYIKVVPKQEIVNGKVYKYDMDEVEDYGKLIVKNLSTYDLSLPGDHTKKSYTKHIQKNHKWVPVKGGHQLYDAESNQPVLEDGNEPIILLNRLALEPETAKKPKNPNKGTLNKEVVSTITQHFKAQDDEFERLSQAYQLNKESK